MELHEQLEELARKHGATSYRNRADTQNPAYGFTPAGLLNLLAEVTGEARKQAIEAEREACAQVCDEMHEHYSALKDTALLNGDVDLSNASSGEPRACEFLAAAIRARGKP